MAETFPEGRVSSIADWWLPDVETTIRLFSAHRRAVAPEWTYPEHAHRLFELNWLLSGRQRMRINGKSWEQRPGDLLLIQPGDVHSCVVAGDAPMTYFCLHFDIDEPLFRGMLRGGGPPLLPAASEPVRIIAPALERVLGLVQSNRSFSMAERMRTLAAVFELFARLGEALDGQRSGVSAVSSQGAAVAAGMAERIERAVESLEDGGAPAAEPPAPDREREQAVIGAIVRKTGYSASYCHSVFRRAYGMSPRQYLSALKLRKAKLLLMNGELSVEQAAAALGYRDISHFSRQFARWTGLSPTAYRQRLE